MNTFVRPGDNVDLTEERQKCVFDTDKLGAIFYGSKHKLDRRRQFEDFITSLPEFKNEKPSISMSRLERFEINSKKSISFYEHLPEQVNLDDQMEIAQFYDKFFTYEGAPLSLHFFVFLPNLLNSMEGEQQAYWLEKALNREIIGSYSQTEMGHGSNLRKLETTATYDKATDSFIIHSPTITATKWWPGSLGKTCNVTIVVAQLYIEGKCLGPHSFIVPIRDFKTHYPLEGITVGDIGPKFAFSGLDNGYLIFNQVTIPRTYMFMKYAQVTKEGQYIKPLHEKAAYGSMIFVRSIMLTQQAQYLAMAATIATRYSCVRRQGNIDENDVEEKILNYQTQQYRILPQLARAWAFNAAGTYIMKLFTQVNEEMTAGNADLLPELHCLTSGLKSVVSFQAGLGIEQCRMSCGGHGYSHASGFPTLYATQIGGCTYEGENMVMLQQCARYLMKIAQSVKENTNLVGRSSKLFGYFFKNHTAKPTNLLEIFETISYHATMEVYEKLTNFKLNGMSHEKAWHQCTVDLSKASRAHVRVFLTIVYRDLVQNIEDVPINKVMSLLEDLWLKYEMLECAQYALMYNLVDGTQLKQIKEDLYADLEKVRPHAVSLVDSFDFTDRDMVTVIGRRDGHVYSNLLKWAESTELNQFQVLPSHSKYFGPLTRGEDPAQINRRLNNLFASSNYIPDEKPNLSPEACNEENVDAVSVEILRTLFNENYDKQILPNKKGVDVNIELALQNFNDVSEKSASFTADVLLSEVWQDKRLDFSRYSHCIENLTLNYQVANKIWQPFTCIVNSKKSFVHSSPSQNIFLMIYPNGTIWLNTRIQISGPCYISLVLFPLDQQECEIIIESYAYNTDKVRLNWRPWSPVFSYATKTKLPDFEIIRIQWDKQRFRYAAGLWDQLSVSFILKRKLFYYLLYVYTPIYICVLVSWIAFWIDHKSLPSRMTIAVSALMSLTFQYGNVSRNTSSKASYLKASDIWILVSCLFVFASLIELAFVGYIDRVNRQNQEINSYLNKKKKKKGEYESICDIRIPDKKRYGAIDIQSRNSIPNGNGAYSRSIDMSNASNFHHSKPTPLILTSTQGSMGKQHEISYETKHAFILSQ
uniref:Acyl-coenzyme A oxidase n=1 Tax=Rhabditophanes sp. KR3021 TaxID=114890 RepID=A0AC35TSJ1_9BILA